MYKQRIKNFFNRSPRRISLGLSILKFGKAALSVYSVILSAKYFGASLERDAWVIAGSVVFILIQLFFGPINETFRAKFVHIREEQSEEKAIQSTASLVGGIFFISLIVTIVIEIFPSFISNIFAPGFNAAQKNVLSLMLRWLIPSLLLNELTLIWIAILNTYKSFYLPDIRSLFSVAINVVCIIILAPIIGIYSLIVSSYIGVFFLILILINALRNKKKDLLKINLPTWKAIKPFVVFSAPFYLPYFFGQGHLMLEKVLCTLLGIGSVSILDYARKFIDIPMGVIFGVVTTVLTPTLASYFSNRRENDFNNEVLKFIRMIILGILPLVTLLIICPKELVELILLRGAFKQIYADVTARTLSWLSIGVIGAVFYVICGQAMVAKKKVNLFALVSMFQLTLSMVVNLILFKKIGIVIFGFSWGISLFIAGVFLYFYICGINFRYWAKELFKLIVIICSVFLFCYFLRVVINSSWMLNNFQYHIARLCLITVIFFFAVLLVIFSLFIFQFGEKRLLINYIMRIKKFHV